MCGVGEEDPDPDSDHPDTSWDRFYLSLTVTASRLEQRRLVGIHIHRADMNAET